MTLSFKTETPDTAALYVNAKTRINGTTSKLPAQSGLYQAVWRWHFYAALFVVPFILVFAVTGGIYTFRPQLEGWIYRDLHQVTPTSAHRSPDAQVGSVLAKFPGSHALAYIPPEGENTSAQVRIKTAAPEDKTLTVAVNPHDGVVLGSMSFEKDVLHWVRKLHGALLLGKSGQMIQELAASWSLVLVITGLYLWWPRRGSRFWGQFLPRINLPGRFFWRDIHAVSGFWVSGLLFLLIVTGLPWSVVSGDLIHNAAARIGKGEPDTGLPWNGGGSRSVKSLPIEPPANKKIDQSWTTTHAQRLAGDSNSRDSQSASRLPLAQVLDIAHALRAQNRVQGTLEIRMPVDKQGVFSLVNESDSNPSAILYAHIDQYTGRVLKTIDWNDFGPLAQAIAIGVSLHEGHYLGWPNQLVCLLACLGVILMSLAGVLMWWHRRPTSGLGVPPLPTNFRLNPPVTALIILLALLIPLMGASLLLILTGETLFRKVNLRSKKGPQAR